MRQGNVLSCTVFNLAAEPLLRAAKSVTNPGFLVFDSFIKATAYADDIAVIANSAVALQATLDELSRTACSLGLKFNAGKCACMALRGGRSAAIEMSVHSTDMRCLGPDEQECYLGVPMGAKLRFRPPESMVVLMDLVANSLLPPWQKLEVLRGHLLPSLSHHLASGRVEKAFLSNIDGESAKFLRLISHLPDTSTLPFLYADRNVGGLGMTSLVQDADVWLLARAAQLLSSSDPTVASISWAQLNRTILRGLRLPGSAEPPFAEYLSGSIEGCLYRARYGNNQTITTWGLARKAAKRIKVQFDVSGDRSIRLIADDVTIHPLKAVRGLRLAIRKRWTSELIEKPVQGRAAASLALHPSKDTTRQVAGKGGLMEWQLLPRARLDLLPL